MFVKTWDYIVNVGLRTAGLIATGLDQMLTLGAVGVWAIQLDKAELCQEPLNIK